MQESGTGVVMPARNRLAEKKGSQIFDDTWRAPCVKFKSIMEVDVRPCIDALDIFKAYREGDVALISFDCFEQVRQ